MSTMSKFLSSFVGHLKSDRGKERSYQVKLLPPPELDENATLAQSLRERRSSRDFSAVELPLPILSGLLWAAYGVNRRDGGGRTAPSALNAQEIDIYVALPEAVYLYDCKEHQLRRIADQDIRRVTGYQDFVDDAPLNLIYVADYAHVSAVSTHQKAIFSAASVGAIAQNVYLYCAAMGLCTVVRGWFEHKDIEAVLKLGSHEHVLLCQTVGYPPRNKPLHDA